MQLSPLSSGLLPEATLPKDTTNSLHVEWRNVEYAAICGAPPNLTRKSVIDLMSGVAYPGEVLGLLGDGKSTLLDVLAGRISPKLVSGSVTMNGLSLSKEAMRRRTAYVREDHALERYLTVREALQFAAELRIADKTIEEKMESAQNLISFFQLERFAECVIGIQVLTHISPLYPLYIPPMFPYIALYPLYP